MSSEDAQIEQRRANLNAITALGIRPYPNKFATTDSVTALVDALGDRSKEALETERVETLMRELFSERVSAVRKPDKCVPPSMVWMLLT